MTWHKDSTQKEESQANQAYLGKLKIIDMAENASWWRAVHLEGQVDPRVRTAILDHE